MNSTKKPNITPTPDGPYMVNALKNFANQKGPIDTEETMALCRCGGSANKPFCDGTHKKTGFRPPNLKIVLKIRVKATGVKLLPFMTTGVFVLMPVIALMASLRFSV